MGWPLKIQGRLLTESSTNEINELLKEHPDWNRSRLHIELSKRWNRQRPDGKLKTWPAERFCVSLSLDHWLSFIRIAAQNSGANQRYSGFSSPTQFQGMLYGQCRQAVEMKGSAMAAADAIIEISGTDSLVKAEFWLKYLDIYFQVTNSAGNRIFLKNPISKIPENFCPGTYQEKEHFKKIVNILNFTDKCMYKIEKVWRTVF